MRFLDSVLKVLGFESESKPKPKTKQKKQPVSKAAGITFNLKEEKKPSDINGIPVFYCDAKDQLLECIKKVRQIKPVIANLEECSSKDVEKHKEFLNGAAFAINATIKEIGSYVYLIIPEGVELEIEE